MKKFILLLIVPFLSFGQNDTIKEINLYDLSIKIEGLEKDIININSDLDNFQSNQQLGIGLQILGGVITSISISKNNSTMSVIGMGVTLGGSIISIDAYKWLRKKDWRKKEGFTPLLKRIRK